MASYRLYTVLPALLKFLEDLTNWYIRFNRLRMKEDDSIVCLNVLFYVLFNMSKLMAPFTPFLAEYMYLQLRPLIENSKESIHFYDMPTYQKDDFSFGDNLLTQKIESLKQVIVLGRTTRLDKCKVSSFKTPLLKVTVVHEDANVVEYLKEFVDYIASELNVLEVEFHAGEKGYATLELDPDFMKIRDVCDKNEVGKMVKVVKAFCSNKQLELVQQLRKQGKITYEEIEITQEICHVKLVPTNESAGADENGFLLQFDMT